MAGKSSKPSKTISKGSERPPAIDKLLKPAIGIALALLAYQFFKGIAAEIPRINVDDEMALREVFFGEGEGLNYAVLCHTEDSKIPISSVFQEAASDKSSPAQFRLLDCDHILASSEKSVIERFKLNIKTRPTIFVSGKIGEPKQVCALLLYFIQAKLRSESSLTHVLESLSLLSLSFLLYSVL
jgi:hypothetical protein